MRFLKLSWFITPSTPWSQRVHLRQTCLWCFLRHARTERISQLACKKFSIILPLSSQPNHTSCACLIHPRVSRLNNISNDTSRPFEFYCPNAISAAARIVSQREPFMQPHRDREKKTAMTFYEVSFSMLDATSDKPWHVGNNWS